MTTLICDCNQTMPLAPKTLGAALAENLPLHSTLCRREAPAFQRALAEAGDEPVVVACTQEARLFTELAAQTPGASAPLRFVNIRETGGWSRDAKAAMPKIAALLAAAHLPEPEPVATVSYASQGRLLIVGALDAAEQAAALVADALEVTVFSRAPGRAGGAQAHRHPVLAGRIDALSGWLGAFRLKWTQGNPIDLDLCTRCNACIAVCPEQAIGFDYQIDAGRCTSHGDCVRACGVAGAIDLRREARTHEAEFDLVLDLGDAPLFGMHAPPQGYFHLPGGVQGGPETMSTLMRLRALVGEFEKPKFFHYDQKICAHSRNARIGCDACIRVCSAEAIASDTARQRIVVNPNLCVGCGACATVCPTGALGYAYPAAPEQGRKWRTLLSTYAAAGGRGAALLLHSQEGGQALIEQLGRAAQLRRAAGVPAHVIPVALWHAASTGIELWLGAIAFGAQRVLVLCTGEEAPQYRQALRAQMEIAQALLHGLGYSGMHFALIEAGSPAELDAALAALPSEAPRVPERAARFAVGAQKRAALDMAIDHLMDEAPALRAPPAEPLAIALPAGAPLGGIAVHVNRCTLCMACVGVCPAGALRDNPSAPQLRFVEKNCVQCGLCARTCPENAIQLVPRLLAAPERKEAVLVAEDRPWACVRCGKPFGTQKAVEATLGRLGGHAMFQGEALERLKMCSDCRVIDLYSASNEARIV